MREAVSQPSRQLVHSLQGHKLTGLLAYVPDLFTNWIKIPTLVWQWLWRERDSFSFSLILEFPKALNQWPPVWPEPLGPLNRKELAVKTRSRLEVAAATSTSEVLQEFFFWTDLRLDEPSVPSQWKQQQTSHSNFRAAKKGKLQLHSLKQNILLVREDDETREDSKNSTAPVGILAIRFKNRNTYFLILCLITESL